MKWKELNLKEVNVCFFSLLFITIVALSMKYVWIISLNITHFIMRNWFLYAKNTLGVGVKAKKLLGTIASPPQYSVPLGMLPGPQVQLPANVVGKPWMRAHGLRVLLTTWETQMKFLAPNLV